ncbi:hypothetical protein DITRI_Ditri10aG0071200 [Diplodiscus trichospermus]
MILYTQILSIQFLQHPILIGSCENSLESVHITVKELEESFKEVYPVSLKWHANTSIQDALQCYVNMSMLRGNGVMSNFGAGFRPLVQFSDEDIIQIVSTNLIGSILCTREATCLMKNQPKGGHIFNMDGAGPGGSSTSLTAVNPHSISWHGLYRSALKGTGKAINYLTPPRILLALVTAWMRLGRSFDEQLFVPSLSLLALAVHFLAPETSVTISKQHDFLIAVVLGLRAKYDACDCTSDIR